MRTWIFLLLAALTPWASAADHPLEPLGWLADRCWTGTLPNGRPDTHCYRWQYGNHFLRDRHVVPSEEGDYEGETLYAWDPEQEKIVYWYWTNTGSISTGTAQVEGETVVFPEHHTLEDGSVMDLMNVLRRLGPNRYEMITRRRTGEDEWQEMWRIEFRAAD